VGSFFQWRTDAHTDTYIAGVPVSELPGKPQGCRYLQVRCAFSVAHWGTYRYVYCRCPGIETLA